MQFNKLHFYILISMRNVFIISILLSFNTVLAQNEFNYFSYKVFNSNNDLQSNKQLEGLINKNNDTIFYELKLHNSKAILQAVEVLDNSQSKLLNLNKVFKDTQGKFYYDEKERIVENQKNVLGKTFIVRDHFESFNWDIQDEFEKIDDRICRKAILTKKEKDSRGREKDYKITVWYDDSFPQNISPFGLVGLDGLIVKIDFNGSFVSILNEYKNIKIDKPILPFKTGIYTTEAEIQNLIVDYFIKRREQVLGVDKD